jgi:hypothetical protein
VALFKVPEVVVQEAPGVKLTALIQLSLAGCASAVFQKKKNTVAHITTLRQLFL